MNILNNVLFSNPFLLNLWMFLDEDVKKGQGTEVKGFNNILKMAVYVGGTIIAILLIIGIVKAALEYSKGSGSGGIGKIIGMVLFLVFCLGMMVLALRWTDLQGVGNTIGQKGLEIVDNVAQGIGGGTSTQS